MCVFDIPKLSFWQGFFIFLRHNETASFRISTLHYMGRIECYFTAYRKRSIKPWPATLCSWSNGLDNIRPNDSRCPWIHDVNHPNWFLVGFRYQVTSIMLQLAKLHRFFFDVDTVLSVSVSEFAEQHILLGDYQLVDGQACRSGSEQMIGAWEDHQCCHRFQATTRWITLLSLVLSPIDSFHHQTIFLSGQNLAPLHDGIALRLLRTSMSSVWSKISI